MTSKRLRPLITGGIVVAALLVLRLVLPGILPSTLGQVASFLTVFLAILMAFIFLIAFVASELGGKVSRRLYKLIEGLTIAGILLGVLGMFQPWAMLGYRIGFHVLLASTLAFTLWSHVSPRLAPRDEGPAAREYAEE